MQLSGYIEKRIGGKVRAFKFGIGTFMRLSKGESVELDKIDEYINGLNDYERLAVMLYYAAIFGCQINGWAVDFNKANVESWIDEISDQDLTEICNVIDQGKIFGHKLEDIKKKMN